MKHYSTLFCFFFCFATSMLAMPAKAQVNVNDSLALVDLYNSTNGPHWFHNTNWLTTAPVSTWYGVFVVDNQIKSISLDRNNLKGSLPISIGNFTQLTGLTLSNNPLSGPIPAAIGKLTTLESLALAQNQLSGSIPSSIGDLINLHHLYLNSNQLSGTVPADIGKLANLYGLFLGHNQLSGAIPVEIGKCTSLYELRLESNQLSGAIPASISNLKNLGALSLSYNQLSGSIPAVLEELTHLDALRLEFNQLSGTIPNELGKLVNMSTLFLNHNQLSGTIPASFRRLENLSEIVLSSNQLTQGKNVFFSADNVSLFGFVKHNLFTFNGLEFIAKNYPSITYTPQDTILPIHQHSNALSVSAGGTLSNNTYKWHQVGSTNIITIKNDSTFTPQQSGKYFVTVKNKIAKKLTLHSDTIDFTLSPVKLNNTFITKALQPATIIQHMQVYPNPAKDIVHIQVNGAAIIAVANSDGKVLLTKSIRNTAQIDATLFASGIYYINNKTTGEVLKIVVMH